VTDDIHAERRIHQLEEQLRTARDDALEEAVKRVEFLKLVTPLSAADHRWNEATQAAADQVRKLKGTGA
jgi:hypothetical protein